MVEFKKEDISPVVKEAVNKTDSWWEGFQARRTERFAENRLKNQQQRELKEEIAVSQDPREYILNQERINAVKARAVMGLIWGAMQRQLQENANRNYRKFKVKHLWFPENDVRSYELRDGNPPADVDRPKHLKGFILHIDLGVVPTDVWAEMKEVFDFRQQSMRQSKFGARNIIDPNRRIILPGR